MRTPEISCVGIESTVEPCNSGQSGHLELFRYFAGSRVKKRIFCPNAGLRFFLHIFQLKISKVFRKKSVLQQSMNTSEQKDY